VFSPDESRLAIGEDYGVIRILNWRTGTVVPVETQTSDGVLALVFPPTAEPLAAGFGFASGIIRLWDSTSGEPRGQLTNHTGYVNALAFTPDGLMLASASADRTIRIWNVADQAELRCLRGHQDVVTALAFLPDSRTLVSGCKDGSVCFWDVTTSNRASGHSKLALSFGFEARPGLKTDSFVPGTLNTKAVDRFGVAFTPDSRSFITTDRDGSVGLWDTQLVRQTERLPALGSNNWSVALSPDGRWLAVGDATGKVNFWDWPARRLVSSRDIPFEWYGWLRFSPSGRFLLATVGLNNNTRAFKMWQTDGWQEVLFSETQARRMGSAALSPDDRLLATGHGNGEVELWDFPTGEHGTILGKHKAPVSEVLFSPDGRTLVSTSMDGQVTLWDVFARRELATLRGHLDWAWSAAFLSDGRRLATGATDAKDAVKVWDPSTQRELLTLAAEGQFFLQLSSSPDGNTLVAISLDGVAHLWRAPSWEEIEAAEKKQKAQ
jgi:WD40 repeat protein